MSSITWDQGHVCMWLAFVDSIEGKVAELAVKAAPYADIEHNAYMIVSELRRVVERCPVAVAEVYLQMLTKFAPTYPQEDVEATIEALYQSGEETRSMANSICERYLEHGVEFPAHVRERFARS